MGNLPIPLWNGSHVKSCMRCILRVGQEDGRRGDVFVGEGESELLFISGVVAGDFGAAHGLLLCPGLMSVRAIRPGSFCRTS